MSHVAGSEMSSDESVSFSDAEDGSCYSQFYSVNGALYDENRFAFVCDPETEAVSDSPRTSSVSDRAFEVDIETGVPEIKVHLDKVERDCRICHLGLDSNSHESGVPIELGSSCKDDLAAAHKNCAEVWFKIKGNKSVTPLQSNESNNVMEFSAVAAPPATESRNFWHAHRFFNFLLACMLIAFVRSWLFHFNVPSN